MGRMRRRPPVASQPMLLQRCGGFLLRFARDFFAVNCGPGVRPSAHSAHCPSSASSPARITRHAPPRRRQAGVHATRDDQEFTFFRPDVPIPKLHAKPTVAAVEDRLTAGNGFNESCKVPRMNAVTRILNAIGEGDDRAARVSCRFLARCRKAHHSQPFSRCNSQPPCNAATVNTRAAARVYTANTRASGETCMGSLTRKPW
jgi:hypothetical protein